MINLDQPEEIKKLDSGEILDSIRQIPLQIEQAWQEITQTDIPQNCTLAKNVVIAGMGGSALGGRIIDALIAERSRVPIEIFNDYHIPYYVNQNSLVIISSYSGSTEETLSDFYDALNKKAQIFGLTCGGKLQEMFIQNNIPAYIIDPRYNPSNQPRFGLGYSLAGILAILSRCGYIHTLNEEITSVLTLIKKYVAEIDIDVSAKENIAKSLALKLLGSLPILVASEHLVGSAHAFKNILNETAKTLSILFELPELNHHLMEGLQFPLTAKQILKFVFIESNLYHPRVQKRYPLTQEVITKNQVNYISYRSRMESKLTQTLEILLLGCFVSYYLAILNGTDPKIIPWVDYFKKKMGN